MKRIIAIALVLIMVPCAVFADSRKDTAGTIRDYAKDVLVALSYIYEKSPSSFDEDYAYLFYWYAKMYFATRMIYSAEISMDLKAMTGDVELIDAQKQLARSSFLIYDLIDDSFKKWMDGENTYEDFCKLAIPIVSAGFNAE